MEILLELVSMGCTLQIPADEVRYLLDDWRRKRGTGWLCCRANPGCGPGEWVTIACGEQRMAIVQVAYVQPCPNAGGWHVNWRVESMCLLN